MAERNKRDIGLFLAGLAAGLVLVLIPQWAGSAGREPVPADLLDARESPPEAAAPSPGAALEGAPPPVVDDTNAPYDGTPSASVDAASPPAHARRTTAFRLVFKGAYLAGRDDGIAYALLAGAAGVDDEEEVPSIWTETGTQPLLLVPGGGTYDVGYRQGVRVVLVEGVAIKDGETKAVELALPPKEHVDVVWDGEAVPMGRQVSLVLLAQSEARRWLPGRRDRPSFHGSRYFPHGTDRPARLEVPPGERLSVVVGVQRTEAKKLVPDPSRCAIPSSTTVRGGDTLRITLGTGMSLALAVVGRPKPRSDVWMRVQVVVEQDGRQIHNSPANVFLLGVGSKRTKPTPLTLALVPGAARITLSGEHIQPAELALVVPDRTDDKPDPKPHELVVRPRTDWSALEGLAEDPVVEGLEPLTLLFEGVAKPMSTDYGPDVVGRFASGGGEPDEARHTEVDSDEPSIEPKWRMRAKQVLFTYSGRFVSNAMRLPRSGAVTVKLRPAGLLVVSTEEILPGRLGSLRLERVDGLPLYGPPLQEAPIYVAWADLRPYVYPGTVIGPLAAGAHRFRVYLGQTRLRDVTATVRAGATTPLVIKR